MNNKWLIIVCLLFMIKVIFGQQKINEKVCGTQQNINATEQIIASPNECESSVPEKGISNWYAGEEIVFKTRIYGNGR